MDTASISVRDGDTQQTTTLCYVYNWLGQQEQKVSCLLDNFLDTLSGQGDALTLKVAFEITQRLDPEEDDETLGSSAVGNIKLYICEGIVDDATINGNEVVSGNVTFTLPVSAGAAVDPRFGTYSEAGQFLTQPGKFSLTGEGLNIGRDAGQPVAIDYDSTQFEESPEDFEGEPLVGATIKNVVVTITNDLMLPGDPEQVRAASEPPPPGSPAALKREAKKERQAKKEFLAMMSRD